jgi:hypothetical protein
VGNKHSGDAELGEKSVYFGANLCAKSGIEVGERFVE